VDEVGQPGVVQPGTGDGSRDDATRSRAVADDDGAAGSSSSDSQWPNGDPLSMAWSSAGRSVPRPPSDWYGQATARNVHDRYPTSGAEPHPSEDSGTHWRGHGDRHPSDPRGFAPVRQHADPSPSGQRSTGGESLAGANPSDRRDPSAGPELRSENPSHAAPESDSEAWRAPDGNRYWSRTSTGPARGTVPVTGALTAETIEAPLLAAAAARPYGEPVSAAIRLPQVFVPRPRAGESSGPLSGEAVDPHTDAVKERPPAADAPADATGRRASALGEPPYVRASAAVPVRSARPDDSVATPVERHPAPSAASYQDRRPSIVDGDVIVDGEVVPRPATIPQPRAASTPPVVAMSAADQPAADDWSGTAQHAASDHGTSEQRGASREQGASSETDGASTGGSAGPGGSAARPGGSAAPAGGPEPETRRPGPSTGPSTGASTGASTEPPRAAAIPMPGRSPRPADSSARSEATGSRDVNPSDRTGAGSSAGGELDPTADVSALTGSPPSEYGDPDDVLPIFRQTGHPQRADVSASPAPSTEEAGQREPSGGDTSGWSAPREVRNRRGPWLRGGGSIRSGRFGGRPISMFSSSPHEEDRPPDVGRAEATSRNSGDGGGPTVAMRPAPYPGGSEVAEPPGAAEHDWDDRHRFALVDQPMLPHRVPAKPDVPFADTGELDDFDEGPDEVVGLPTPDLDGPELSRIASRLRHDEESVPELPDELDVAAVLAAVRQVHGVRSAQLRPNPGGVHILRLDLADDADAGRVSRQVARLLKERMGLAAEPRRPRTAPGAAPSGSSGAAPGVGPTETRVAGGPSPSRAGFAPPSRPGAPPRSTGPNPGATAESGASAAAAAAGPIPTRRVASSAQADLSTSAAPPAPAGPFAPAAPKTSAAASGPSAATTTQATPSDLLGTASGTASTRRAPTTGPDPVATDPDSRRQPSAASTVAASTVEASTVAASTVAGAPGFRPTMPAEPGAFLPGMTTVAPAAPLPPVPGQPPRIVIDQVHVSTLGTEATVEVRLHFGAVATVGKATGPAVDAYLLRLAAQAAAGAIDSLIATAEIGNRSRRPARPARLTGPARPAGPAGPAGRVGAAGPVESAAPADTAVSAEPAAAPIRCYIEHAGVVPFGSSVVAVVVVLVSGDGRVEQLVGSALVAGDPRHSIVRATLAAVNRRLESLLT
jgi:hypothetical protein